MKKLLLLFIISSLFSCKSGYIYYAYENLETKTYAILQISKKGTNIQYKSASEIYPDKYIYIYGTRPYIRNNQYIKFNSFYDLTFITSTNKLDACPNFDDNDREILVYLKEDDRIVFEKNKNMKCFKERHIYWFPPYMTKVKKIDYTKFPKDIREAIIAIDKEKPYKKIIKILKVDENENSL